MSAFEPTPRSAVLIVFPGTLSVWVVVSKCRAQIPINSSSFPLPACHRSVDTPCTHCTSCLSSMSASSNMPGDLDGLLVVYAPQYLPVALPERLIRTARI
jgi:hypothetical protein